jgi:indolepyruvate ferredoxin oxidoreductase alpha subunit
MEKLMLLGNEAVAQGALDAGLSGCYAYPGTPSTEITEYIQASAMARQNRVQSEWASNEKTAMEAALGMSYAGKRAMVCMKHVGLNVAADPFVNSAITGANGGLVYAVADDPSMHSSQNEQDTRFYGKFAMVPVLEPANQQEAYDMAYYGFELSEKFRVPVVLRLTTRLAHSRAGVTRKEVRKQNELKLPGNPLQFILLPSMARKSYNQLLTLQKDFEKEAKESPFNALIDGPDKDFGIIACGLAYNYLIENYDGHKSPYPVLKICQYPVPVDMIRKLLKQVNKKVMVIEEGYPLVEEMMRGYLDDCLEVHGKMDGYLPRAGELNPDLVAGALGLPGKIINKVPEFISKRPPALCKGCGHIDTFLALNEAIADFGEGRVFSDIGCYTLGAYPPYNAIYTCVDMGASLTMAKGAADAGLVPAVTVIGDSTFTHSGITGLLDAVNENSPITVIISDNSTTAMTGGQKSAATGRLAGICRGVGVEPDHIRTIIPLKKHHKENAGIIREELEYNGISVVISQRECIQTAVRKKR